MTDANNLLTKRLPLDPSYDRTLDPDQGTLIPSPISTYTHASSPAPFEATQIFRKGMFFLPEHEIQRFSLPNRAAVQAAQDVVVAEMTVLREKERQREIIEALPIIVYDLANRSLISIDDFEFWRNELGWSRSTNIDKSTQSSRIICRRSTWEGAVLGQTNDLIWDHDTGYWITEDEQAAQQRELIVAELERIDELRYAVEDEYKLRLHQRYQSGLLFHEAVAGSQSAQKQVNTSAVTQSNPTGHIAETLAQKSILNDIPAIFQLSTADQHAWKEFLEGSMGMCNALKTSISQFLSTSDRRARNKAFLAILNAKLGSIE